MPSIFHFYSGGNGLAVLFSVLRANFCPFDLLMFPDIDGCVAALKVATV